MNQSADVIAAIREVERILAEGYLRLLSPARSQAKDSDVSAYVAGKSTINPLAIAGQRSDVSSTAQAANTLQ